MGESTSPVLSSLGGPGLQGLWHGRAVLGDAFPSALPVLSLHPCCQHAAQALWGVGRMIQEETGANSLGRLREALAEQG